MLARSAQRIEEIDQLIEAWPGSEIHPVQISTGPLNFCLNGAIGDGLNVLTMSLAPRLADQVHIDQQRIEVVLVERPMISMGLEIRPPALLINHSGREYRSVLEPGFRSLELMLDASLLEKHPLGSRLADARAVQDQTVIPLTETMATVIRAAADGYVAASEFRADDPLRPCLAKVAHERVLRTLCTVFDRQRGMALEKKSSPARGSIALAALNEMERIGISVVKVKDVCESLAVSRRSIEKSFDVVLGISPAQYLLACRLNRLRQSLLGSAERVTDGLAEAGFTDASRAARQYKRLFGELPSATLSRTQGRLAAS